MRPRLGGFAANVDAVDARLAAVGSEDPVEHAQTRRLAGAIGPQDAGDFPVTGHEGDIPDGVDAAEALVQIRGFDHGAGPVMLTKNGAEACRSRQVASSCSGAAVSRNSAISFGIHPVATWPWPSPPNVRLRWRRSPRAARSAS